MHDPRMTRSSPARAALLRGITRNVVVLGLVSLLTDISSELLIYVVPLFLANVLAATPSIIGIVEGIAESVAAFVKLGSGALSDRIGRRTVLVGTGYATSVIAKSLYIVAAA
jgi:MFS family permease